MIERVIFSGNNGMGLIATNEQETTFINKEPVKLHGVIIEPDTLTALDGLFTRPVRYAGLLKGDNKVMCFHLGFDKNMFEKTDYYCCYYWISENRILNKYKEGTARDFNWINNQWK